MNPTLHERLVQRSLAGRYDLFLGLGGGLTVLGLILFVGALRGADTADRAWHLFHVNWLYFTGLAAGSVAFVAVQKITNAKWSGMIIRFASASAAFLPVSLIGVLLIFGAGYTAIYGPMNAAIPELQHAKAVWLSHDFMFGRLFIGLGVLTLVGWRLIRADLVPDMLAVRGAVPASRRGLFDRWTRGYDGSPEAEFAQQERIDRLAPTYAVLYAIVLTLVAFDGIMALQPHWFSNLLGGFFFMGSFLGAHMLLALMMIYGASHLGVTDLVSPKQRHDLGKLCFGFTVFWTYLMWAQFLVIWYGNLPEETGFVFARLWGHWLPIGKAVLIGMFIVPFFGLLGVAPKKVRATHGLLRRREPDGPLARAVPPGHAVGQRAAGAGLQPARGGADAPVSRALPAELRAVRPHLPDDLAQAGRDHPRAGARPRERAGLGRVRARGVAQGLRVAGVDRPAGQAASVGLGRDSTPGTTDAPRARLGGRLAFGLAPARATWCASPR